MLVPPKAPVVCLTGALALLVAGCGGPTAPLPAAGLAVAALEGEILAILKIQLSSGTSSDDRTSKPSSTHSHF